MHRQFKSRVYWLFNCQKLAEKMPIPSQMSKIFLKNPKNGIFEPYDWVTVKVIHPQAIWMRITQNHTLVHLAQSFLRHFISVILEMFLLEIFWDFENLKIFNLWYPRFMDPILLDWAQNCCWIRVANFQIYEDSYFYFANKNNFLEMAAWWELIPFQTSMTGWLQSLSWIYIMLDYEIRDQHPKIPLRENNHLNFCTTMDNTS